MRNAVAQTPIGKKVTVKLIREEAQDDRGRNCGAAEIVRTAWRRGEQGWIGANGAPPDLDVRELNEELTARYGLKAAERGVVVVRVKPGSTAEEMGVREGDIILDVNRKAVGSLKSYEQAASGLAKGQAVLCSSNGRAKRSISRCGPNWKGKVEAQVEAESAKNQHFTQP